MTEKILIVADHGGYVLKEAVKAAIPAAWIDLGTDSTNSVDYPDFGYALARGIAEGKADKGIAICGSGIGISIAVNRNVFVRAALCCDVTMARLARAHNDANVLVLGARLIGEALALEIVETFLSTPFEGGRHAARVEKLSHIS